MYLGWHTWSMDIFFMAVGWTTCSGPTYMSAGMLGAWVYYPPVGWTAIAGPHICQPACLEYGYILWLWDGPLVVGPQMSAGMLGAWVYYPPVSWTAHSGPTYMLASMLGVHIISGPNHYMWL